MHTACDGPRFYGGSGHEHGSYHRLSHRRWGSPRGLVGGLVGRLLRTLVGGLMRRAAVGALLAGTP